MADTEIRIISLDDYIKVQVERMRLLSHGRTTIWSGKNDINGANWIDDRLRRQGVEAEVAEIILHSPAFPASGIRSVTWYLKTDRIRAVWNRPAHGGPKHGYVHGPITYQENPQ